MFCYFLGGSGATINVLEDILGETEQNEFQDEFQEEDVNTAQEGKALSPNFKLMCCDYLFKRNSC